MNFLSTFSLVLNVIVRHIDGLENRIRSSGTCRIKVNTLLVYSVVEIVHGRGIIEYYY